MNQLAKTKQSIKQVRVRPMSREVAEVRQNINVIHEALKSIMKVDTHYGTIPGCGKPSLYKPGAEVIIALFKLSTDPVVDDMSKEGEIRYQVKVNITTREGVFVGSGIGECSSQEEKYMWRAALCDREFEVTPETFRRIKFKKMWNPTRVDEINQIRVNPSDMANTILKMAKKRALIDAVLTATGASDIFSQDLQDLPDGFLDAEAPVSNDNVEVAQEPEITESVGNPPAKSQKSGAVISEPQRKRLYAIAMGAGMDKDYFKTWLNYEFDYESSKDVTKDDYEAICSRAEAYVGGTK